MSYETARKLITTKFHTDWDVDDLVVVYENQPEPDKDGPWGRFSVAFGNTNPATIGNQGFVRGIGIANLQIWIPESQGTIKFTQCGDLFAAIFDIVVLRESPVTVHFQTSQMAPGGSTAGYIQRLLRIPFRFDSRS